MSTVILANGRFPTHPIPLGVLTNASRIICCDGSVGHLERIGLKPPTAIVGDLDSVSDKLKVKYADRLFFNPDPDTNDLTKAIHWCRDRGFDEVSILAGTGKRDDHTIGNVSLLPTYMKMGMEVQMITDYGTFVPLRSSEKISSFKGQQISIFSFNNSTLITTNNLKYPIKNEPLRELWMGSLNESLGNTFEVNFDVGPIVIFKTHDLQ